MAGIAERKMTSDRYDNSRAYNCFVRVNSNPHDEKSTKAKEVFNRPLFHLKKKEEK